MTRPHRWPIVVAVVVLVLPLLYLGSFGLLARAQVQRRISLETWASLAMRGPYRPLERLRQDRRSLAGEVCRSWVEYCLSDMPLHAP